ncbi:alpha-glucosidase [Diplodia corticola]|uniref:Alpha-glucosidase n=1 Tax=Diplodia corticola TaxID=236234 RepID=A0A1J9R1H6_9PEZI|nr:alpha-glucosidase [Diplodia corticola]OJD35246.1 alpha-glucosidase [Diplodia corticola]
MQHPLICPSTSSAAFAAAAAVFGTSAPMMAAEAVKTYPLGAFSVQVDQGASSVDIYTQSGAEVWKIGHGTRQKKMAYLSPSPPTAPSSYPFISASTGLTNFSDSSGNFEITTNITSRCTAPSIISVTLETNQTTASPAALTLSGAFTDAHPPHCSAWSWTLTFTTNTTTTPSSPSHPNPHPRLHFSAAISITTPDDDDTTIPAPQNIHLALTSPPNEPFYGLGGTTGLGNLRGWRIPVWAREGGVGRGAEPVTTYLNGDASVSGRFAGGSALTGYTAVAAVVSGSGRWVVLEGSALSVWDLASANGTGAGVVDRSDAWEGVGDKSGDGGSGVVEVMWEGKGVEGWVGVAVDGTNALLEATGALTEVTGRQPPLPDWALEGAILGIQGGQDKVEGIVRDARAAGMPLVGVWLQDWSGTRLQAGAYNVSISRLWWNWEPDAQLYPEWAEWVPHLQEAYGVRTLSYVNTFLANVSNKGSGYNRSFYAEAKAEGRLVLNATADDGSPWELTSGPGIDAGLLDISNETTVQWFKDLFKQQYYSVPISGAMQDFGEYLDVSSSVSISSGTVSPRLFHNTYPFAWAKLLREATIEAGVANDTLGFHRSASTFSAPYTNLFWVGDQNIDTTREDGMRAAISSTFHIGFSGFAQAHADVGGYTNTLAPVGNITRSAALLGRWAESVGAFGGAAFRTHEGNIPQVNAQAYTNASTLAYHAYAARLYASVKAYRKAALEEYQQRGWPVVRHPAVYAPNDTLAVATVDEVFWLGEALLVAPVYDLRAQRLPVYLPRVEIDSEGTAVDGGVRYQHLWTGELFEPGKTVVVDAPWGKPGVFVRWPLKDGEKELLQGLFDFVKKENGTVLTA